MSTIRISGTLNLASIWNLGKSDADTLNIAVAAVQWRPATGAAWLPVTTALAGAYIAGKGGVQYPVFDGGKITVRLQGIDAPELHNRPQRPPAAWKPTPAQLAAFAAANKEYRQPLGETCAAALLGLLRPFADAGGVARCQAVSEVGGLEDLFDMYGRAVAEVIAVGGRRRLNINRKLVENGLAFPALYNSMSAEEIAAIQAAAAKARRKNLGIWRHYAQHVGIDGFNPALVFRKQPAFVENSDAGPVVFPKFFRRQCSFWAYTQAGLPVPAAYADYLRQTKDNFFFAAELPPPGSTAKPVKRFLYQQLDDAGNFTTAPENVVFYERPSTLKAADGKNLKGF